MRLIPLSVLAMLAPGCVSARWVVAQNRALSTVVVCPARVSGDADAALVATRRQALIASLRARGYDAIDGIDDESDVPRVMLDVDGERITDEQRHAPDDTRHHIVNNLHYSFVVYKVGLTVLDQAGGVVARGRAEADRDPGPAVRALAMKMFEDVPPAPTVAHPAPAIANR
jgi:hypothetical protein